MTSRRESGFTLMELLVVLAIAALAAAVAMPQLARHLTGPSLDTAAAQLRAALRGARSTAMVEDRAVIFEGDAAGGYWLDRRHFNLPSADGRPLRVATRGGAQIAFYPSGGSSGGGVVVSGGEASREIAVDALTGRADAIR
ncbi:MAG: prepilin-type N-terminal cleavage/methylation domain-containing protein [Alphaproteobacteria bacterium]|nr:prepilin-type N-terminal cleavage/methylation domain-containing protein [Alphaproteobacteria bacterium]